MSREIKFRLYSKHAKKYIDYLTIGFSKTGELRSYSTENGVGPVLEDSYIVEQYTGLKDKNGKEIYEGDIFRNTINGGTWRVSWNEKEAAFWVDSGVAGCSLGEFDWDRSNRKYGFIRKNCEVIGNVHEKDKLVDFDHVKGGGEMTEKEDWEKMQAGEWHCACCDTYLEPIDSTHVICPRCGLKHRFKNGVIQTKGNMMEDYE